jgi:hypothetical protein
MRKAKSRWILSLASVVSVAAAACADEHAASEPDQDADPAPSLGTGPTHFPGVVVNPGDAGGPTHFPGVVINPGDAGGPTQFPGVVVNPGDAGGPIHFPGVLIQPDAGNGHPPGLVLAPDAGTHPINGLVVRPPDAGTDCVLLGGILVAPSDGGACPGVVFPGVIVHEQDAATGLDHPVGVVVRPPQGSL